MRKALFFCFLIFIQGFLFSLKAQDEKDGSVPDEYRDLRALQVAEDSTVSSSQKPIIVGEFNPVIDLVKPEFKPNSTKAVIYSAILPGLGQIYNRRYWKLPIIYGGFMGVVYGVSWNGRYYDDYKLAYKDLAMGTGNSWVNFVQGKVTEAEMEQNPVLKQQYLDNFRRKKDYYRRNRDLAIIVGVGLYALCMIDAYVDAQLYDFNMSPDISMRIEPIIWAPTQVSTMSVGIQCKLVF